MNDIICQAAITLVRKYATLAILSFLMLVEALSSITIDRKWTAFGANMTQVYDENFTEFTTTSITVCVSLASRSLPANLACLKSSRCVFASVYLPRVGGEQTEGFTCWYSQVCSHEEALMRENENVAITDPLCPGTRTLTCSVQGLIFQDVPPPRTTCTAPFTQHSFGCMYDSQEFMGTYCGARRYCQELGADIVSPETEQDGIDMMAFYTTIHAITDDYYVGLIKVDDVWRWVANQREPAPPGTGEWGPVEPNGPGAVTIMFHTDKGKYAIGDLEGTYDSKALCQVWVTI